MLLILNKKIENIYIKKIFILFILFILFVSFIITISSKKININSHIILNTPIGYNDHGFCEDHIKGVCFGEGFSDEECKKNIPKQKIGFSYPGTLSDEKKIFDHIEFLIQTYKIKNFVVPGFAYNNFFQKYINYFFEKNSDIKFIGVDTENNHEVWPKNFWQINFLQYFSGYHAGIFAAAWALENEEKLKDADFKKEGKQIFLSTISGKMISSVLKYALGFKLGIEIFNEIYSKNKKNNSKNIEFKHFGFENIGSFDATNPIIKKKVEETTKKLFDKGTSIIFIISSPFIELAITAANQKDDEGKWRHFLIGVDVDAKKQVSKKDRKKIITSAKLKFVDVIRDIYQVDFKNNYDGKDLIIGGHEYASIPNEDKEKVMSSNNEENISIWEKYFIKDKNFKKIINLNDLPVDILGLENEQIVNISKKVEKKDFVFSEGLLEKFLIKLNNNIKLNKKKEKELYFYKDLLNCLNLIKYMKNFIKI